MAPEVNLRIASTWSCVAQHAKSFFRAPNILADVKLKTLQPLLFSRLLYNAGVWPRLLVGQHKRLNGALLKVLHMVSNTPKVDLALAHSDIRVHIATGTPLLKDLLIMLRLRQLPRTCRTAPPFLRHLLDCDETFRQLVCEDMAWLGGHVHQLSDLGEPAHDLGAWVLFCQQYPSTWKKYISIARDRCLAELPKALLDAAVVLPIAPAELSFCCYECGQHFAAAKPLAMHCRMFHAARSPLLIAVHDTTHCLACLSEFHELSRLIQHLRAKTRCYESIVQHALRPPGIDLEVLRQPSRLALKATKSGLARPLVMRLPFVKLAGPLPHWAFV